jgi:hypothetical protein
MTGRKPSVRIKNGYWYSEAGALVVTSVVPTTRHIAEAMSLLWKALAEGSGDGKDSPGGERVRNGDAASDMDRIGLEGKSKGKRRSQGRTPLSSNPIQDSNAKGESRRLQTQSKQLIPIHCPFPR